jgi:hypothetical protein
VKQWSIRAGERVRVIHRFSSSLAQTYTLLVEPTPPGGPVAGTVEVHGSRWLFPKPAVTLPLTAETTVDKGYWDTRYSVYVTPDHDVTVTIGRPRLR